MSAEKGKRKDRSESPYWIGRHKRSFFGGLALLGVTAAAGFSWLDISRNNDTAEQGLAALKRDRACLQVIDDKTPPGKNVATISLASLSPQQRYACRLDKLPSRVNVGDGYGEPRLIVKITDETTIQLASKASMRAAIAQDKADANTSQYNGLPFDALLGGAAIPTMAFLGTLLLSGDYRGFNEAGRARSARQTNASA